MEGAEKQSDVSHSAIDFRQSYIVDRVDSTVREEDTAEISIINQVDKIEAIKVQITKFKRDLESAPHQDPALVKTVENLEYLEQDIGKLSQHLRQVRTKVQDETTYLKQRESQVKDKLELLKAELKQNIVQLDEMDRARSKLEQTVKSLTEGAKNHEKEGESLILQNLKVELSDMQSKVEALQQEVSNLRREADRKDQIIYEKNLNIANLNEELEGLLNKADTDTQAVVRDRLSVGLIQRDSDDEKEDEVDPNSVTLPGDANPENLKKKYLIQVNEHLKTELAALKDSLQKANEFINQLKQEISSLKSDDLRRDSEGGFGLDPNVLDMRSTDMFNMFKEIKKLDEMSQETEMVNVASLRETVRNLKKLGDSALEVQTRNSRQESYNPYLDENSPPKNQMFGRPSDPFEELAKAEVAEKEAVREDMVPKAELERVKEELAKESDRKIDEVNRQLASLRNEMISKDLQISKFKEKNLSMDSELAARVAERNNLIDKIEKLESELVQVKVTPPEVEGEKTEKNDVELEQLKKEILIMKNNTEILKSELDYYKNKVQQSEPKSNDLAPEHHSHLGHSSVHHHSPSHYYPPRDSSQTAGEKPVDILKSQLLDKPKDGTSTLMQSKLDKIEANLQNLATSTLDSRPKPAKDDKTITLNRLNKEYMLVKSSLNRLSQKLEEEQNEHKNIEAELNHADVIKSEEKVIVALEERLAITLEKKEKLKKEYEASVLIEAELKKELEDLVNSIEKEENKTDLTPFLKSALHMSKLAIVDKGHVPLSELPAAKDPEQVKDKSHLQVPSEGTSTKESTHEIPLPQPASLKIPEQPKHVVEPGRIKDNKMVNEQLSNLLSPRKTFDQGSPNR